MLLITANVIMIIGHFISAAKHKLV